MERKQQDLRDAIAQQEDIQKNLSGLKIRSDAAQEQLDDFPVAADCTLRIEDRIDDLKVCL